MNESEAEHQNSLLKKVNAKEWEKPWKVGGPDIEANFHGTIIFSGNTFLIEWKGR